MLVTLCHEDHLRGFVFCGQSMPAVLPLHAGRPARSGVVLYYSMRKRNHMKADQSLRKARLKKALLVAALLLGGYLLASFGLGEMGLVKYYRMKAQYHALNEEIARLRQDNAKLTRDVRSLRSDPARIERIARDKLGLARPGEIVYYYGEP